MGAAWLTGLTAIWLVATVWLSGRHLRNLIDPAGASGVLDVIVPFLLLFVVPPGLGWAAHAAGFTPWLWLVYLLGYELAALFLAFALGAAIYSWWWRRTGYKRSRARAWKKLRARQQR